MKQNTVLLVVLSGVIASQLIDWVALWNGVSASDRFNLRIIETTVSDSDDLAAIVITLKLTNYGRPSTVDNFALEIRQGRERIPTEAVRVDAFTTFDLRSKVGKSQVLKGSEWLPTKTASSPLQTGESRTGFLLFWSREASGIQIIDNEDTQFAITFFDAWGRQHEAVYDVDRLNFQPRPAYAAIQPMIPFEWQR